MEYNLTAAGTIYSLRNAQPGHRKKAKHTSLRPGSTIDCFDARLPTANNNYVNAYF